MVDAVSAEHPKRLMRWLQNLASPILGNTDGSRRNLPCNYRLDARHSADISVDCCNDDGTAKKFLQRYWMKIFPDESACCGYRFPFCNLFCWKPTNRLLFRCDINTLLANVFEMASLYFRDTFTDEVIMGLIVVTCCLDIFMRNAVTCLLT